MSTLLAQKYGIDEVDVTHSTPSFDVATIDVAHCDADTVEAIVLDVASYLMEMRMWVLKNARLVLGKKIAGHPRDIPYVPKVKGLNLVRVGYVPSTVPGQYIAIEQLLTMYDQTSDCDPAMAEMMVVHHRDFISGLIKLAECNPQSYGMLKDELARDYSVYSLGRCDPDAILDHFDRIQSHLSPSQYWYLTRPIIAYIYSLSPALMQDVLVSLASMGHAHRHKWERGDLLLTPNFEAMQGNFKLDSSPDINLIRRYLSERPNCGYYGPGYNQTHRLVYLSS